MIGECSNGGAAGRVHRCPPGVRLGPQDRAEHVRLLRRYARRRTVPTDLRSLLERIEQELRVRQSRIASVFDNESHSRRAALVAELLESEHVALPSFAYHSTIRGRLASISKKGLKPAFRPVWRDAKLAIHCADWTADLEIGRVPKDVQ